ncbi:hypothetical protein E2562_002430 [Oryza meyeriana var. granulata]|uniref:Uncharacterized protein n=1 Tax=Oryza meyeriana var. granulata TaxID=110450 RepID=A0A6G1F2C1_9ORYZ|nr:hypothetical protein E2562_002430 [Oryza meyeriana var. granulata]
MSVGQICSQCVPVILTLAVTNPISVATAPLNHLAIATLEIATHYLNLWLVVVEAGCERERAQMS